MRAPIVDGAMPPGMRLPTQARLAARFGVSRHSVRRALDALAAEGLVEGRQGGGVFVTARRLDYRVGPRVRFAENVTGALRVVLHRGRMQVAPAPICRLLGLSRRDFALVVELLREVGGQPVALTRHWFDARRVPQLLDQLERTCDLPQALAAHGVRELTRTETAIEARLPSRHEAVALSIGRAQPVLVSQARNSEGRGGVVEVSEAIWRGDGVRLLV